MAQRMVKDGYKAVGYTYVNIDDCWSLKERDRQTKALVPDPQRFPGSMKALADTIHGLGLDIGIYGDCGSKTCQLFPGQLAYYDRLDGNYYDLDAKTFAAWAIDSFKFDGCNLAVDKASQLCPPMGTALNKTGRPMLFSCSWPAYENDLNISTNWEQVVETCNLWRSYGDIEDSWTSVLSVIDMYVKNQDIIVKYHGPGHWFDPDQLVIGNFGLSRSEEEAQMSIWCIWSAPLYMSNDLRYIGESSSKILKNKWAIAVNQDKMGIFGLMVASADSIKIFVKPTLPLDDDGCPSYAIAYLYTKSMGDFRMVSYKIGQLIKTVHNKLAAASTEWRKWLHCSQRQGVRYKVIDLNDDGAVLDKGLGMESSLDLLVYPSGVRFVQLFAGPQRSYDSSDNLRNNSIPRSATRYFKG